MASVHVHHQSANALVRCSGGGNALFQAVVKEKDVSRLAGQHGVLQQERQQAELELALSATVRKPRVRR